jgi:hypothetical protein
MRLDELGAREIGILVLLMFIGAVGLSDQLGGLATVGLLIGALYMLSRLVGQQGTRSNTTTRSSSRSSNRNLRDWESEYTPPIAETRTRTRPSPPQPQQVQVNAPQLGEGGTTAYRHALDAARAAGHNPTQMQVLPVDLGVIVYHGSQQSIARTHDVPDNADFIQPYVQLRLPTRAVGKIRFEMVDSDGQVLFIHEVNQPLEKGNNLITPPARLPVHDALATQSAWELRVLADNTLLASHRFEWEQDSAEVIRQHISDDGEISDEMRQMMAANRLEKMSLDDLLSDQPEEAPQRQQQSRR